MLHVFYAKKSVVGVAMLQSDCRWRNISTMQVHSTTLQTTQFSSNARTLAIHHQSARPHNDRSPDTHLCRVNMLLPVVLVLDSWA